MPKSESGRFAWLKRLFGFGKQADHRTEIPEPVPHPVSPSFLGEVQYNASDAIREFGASFIGVVEIASQGSRVTAGTYVKNGNHLTLSKQNLGPLQTGQRRFGFMRNRGGITIGPSSTGAIPTVGEIQAIRNAMEQRGYLKSGGLFLIVVEGSNGEHNLYNLLTGEALQ